MSDRIIKCRHCVHCRWVCEEHLDTPLGRADGLRLRRAR
jgi:hypothetical protein